MPLPTTKQKQAQQAKEAMARQVAALHTPKSLAGVWDEEDAYIIALTAIERTCGESEAFQYTAAKNAVMDETRSLMGRAFNRVSIPMTPEADPADPAPDFTAIIQGADHVDALLRLVSDERQREVLKGLFVEGLEGQQVAARLGVSSATVTRAMQAGLAELAGLIQKV